MQSPTIHISIPDQRLELRAGNITLASYPVSTASAGVGSEPGSMRTPVGTFRISEKFGAGEPAGMIFRSRVPTGEFGTPEQSEDLVQTRILWLDGLDEQNANSHDRYIYIHGTNQESQLGQPASHGCVRMGNSDVIDLFDRVETGTLVFIQP